MNILLNLFIFCIVLFIYIHIVFNYKKSNDLEVYEIEEPSKEKLEEICDIKQPIIFNMYNSNLLDIFNNKYIIDNYSSFDIKIRNTNSIYTDRDGDLYLPFTMQKANDLFCNDICGNYFSENNYEFIEETTLIKNFKYNDIFLRPHMQCHSDYDILFGSINSFTPLKYQLFNRNYFTVTEGSVQIILIPPIMYKYLHVEKDYEYFEFKSSINPWDVQNKFKLDYDKVKPLEITLTKNNIIYIPPYWFYSIKIKEENTIVLNFKYNTYMSTLSIIHELCIKYLQNNNIKHNLFKSVV
jgi:hypothetical protein